MTEYLIPFERYASMPWTYSNLFTWWLSALVCSLWGLLGAMTYTIYNPRFHLLYEIVGAILGFGVFYIATRAGLSPGTVNFFEFMGQTIVK